MRRIGTPGRRDLRPRSGAERLRAAEARHDELLDAVDRQRGIRDQLAAETRAAVNHVGLRVHAVIEEAHALDAEIHALMQALLADDARPRVQRIELEDIYEELEGQVIQPRPRPKVAAEAPRAGSRPAGATRAGAGSGPRVDAEPEPVAPARPRPTERGTLRTLFRRLAEALHPDKVQDDVERARRTEIMKQITVAYSDGDYARLLAIERTWVRTAAGSVAAAPDDGDDLERRVAARERAIEELEVQLAEVERELEELHASDGGLLAREYHRSGGAAGRTGMELAAERDVIRLRDVRDFIVAFRDRAISFERFRAGPTPSREPAAARAAPFDPPFDPYANPFDARAVADLRDALPADLANVIADLERVARDQGVDPRELLRAVRAAAAGAGVDPRPGRGRR